jgi:hypothetical protein
MFEQQSLIFNGLGAQNRTLQKISDFLEAAATDQSDNVASHDNENAAAGVSVMDGPADQYIANQVSFTSTHLGSIANNSW